MRATIAIYRRSASIEIYPATATSNFARPHPPGHLDGDLDRTLVLLLDRMARRDVEFDPVLTVQGAEKLGSGGAIIISGHFFLNHLFLRWLHDRGKRVSVIMTTPPERPRFIGTQEPMEIIEADSLCLVRTRRKVAAGGIVGIPVDCISRLDGTESINTPYGEIFLPDRIMRFAERAGFRCCLSKRTSAHKVRLSQTWCVHRQLRRRLSIASFASSCAPSLHRPVDVSFVATRAYRYKL